jgi:hypothetical protein
MVTSVPSGCVTFAAPGHAGTAKVVSAVNNKAHRQTAIVKQVRKSFFPFLQNPKDIGITTLFHKVVI